MILPALASGLLALALQAETRPAHRPLEQVLPADALFAVWGRDVSPVRDALLGTGPLHDLQEFRKLLAAVDVSHDKLAAEFEKEVGIPLATVLGPIRGPAGLAVFAPEEPEEDDDPRVVFAFGYSGDKADDAIAKVSDELLEKNLSRDGRRTESEFEGARLWTYSRAPRFPPKDGSEGPRDEFFVARAKDWLVIASNRDPMQRVLLALSGKPTPTIASREDFQVAAKRLGPADGVLMSVNFSEIWRMVDESTGGAMAVPILKALGVRSLKGLTFGMGTPPGSLEMRGFLSAPGARTGLLQLFSTPPRELDLGPFAAADVSGAAAFHVDPVALLAEVDRIAAAFMPGGGEQLRKIPVNGIDVRKDVLELLLPPFRSVGTAGPSPSPFDDESMLSFGCKDEARVEQAILQALGGGGEAGGFRMPVETTEYLGHRIHEVQLGMGMGGDEDEEDEEEDDETAGVMGLIRPAFAVAGGHLLVSLTGLEPIRDALRVLGKDVKLLSSTPEFRRATQGFPDRRISLAFQRVGPQFESIGRMFRDRQIPLGFPGAGMIHESVYEILAETFGALGRRYESAASCVSVDDLGFTIVSRMLEHEPAKKEAEKGGK